MFDEDDDDDIFGDKLPFDTPAASRTPFLKHVEPVSTRKTPHMGGETPSYSKSVNRQVIMLISEQQCWAAAKQVN